MKKRFLSLILCGALLNSAASAAVVQLPIGSNTFSRFENKMVSEEALDAPAYINEASRTMVPVRAVSQSLGADVNWLPESRTVEIQKEETKITLTIDSPTAFVNGESVSLDAVPVIQNDRTMVPLRFIGEALGVTVSYANGFVLLDDTEVLLRNGNKVFTLAQLDTLRALYYTWNVNEMGEMDEETFRKSCVHTAILRASSILKIENAFPQAVIPPQEYPSIIAESQSAGTLSDMPLDGMRDLIYERLYFSTGVPLYDVLENDGTDYATKYASEYVCAKHILCENEETAKAVYEKAVAGQDFDTLIKEYGTDPGMLQHPDGYVFTRGEMVLPFEEAAYAANIGEITSPVKTDFGYHVILRLPLPPLSDSTKDAMIYNDIQHRLSESPDTENVKSYEEIMAIWDTAE